MTAPSPSPTAPTVPAAPTGLRLWLYAARPHTLPAAVSGVVVGLGAGLAGLQEFAGNATGLFYTTDEAHEGSRAFLEKRTADYRKYPRRP